MGLAQLFLAQNNIPNVMVPNGDRMQPLQEALEYIFIGYEKAHESDNNQDRERIYEFLAEVIEELPVEYRDFIQQFNAFLVTQVLNGAF